MLSQSMGLVNDARRRWEGPIRSRLHRPLKIRIGNPFAGDRRDNLGGPYRGDAIQFPDSVSPITTKLFNVTFPALLI